MPASGQALGHPLLVRQQARLRVGGHGRKPFLGFEQRLRERRQRRPRLEVTFSARERPDLLDALVAYLERCFDEPPGLAHPEVLDDFPVGHHSARLNREFHVASLRDVLRVA